MKCSICGRDKLSEKELEVHTKYFHTNKQHYGKHSVSGVCPDCGATLIFQEGCIKCQSCGYSKC